MAWDYSKKSARKQAEKDEKWELERLINFGLGRKKLKKALLKKYWHELNIDPQKRRALEIIVWNKKL